MLAVHSPARHFARPPQGEARQTPSRSPWPGLQRDRSSRRKQPTATPSLLRKNASGKNLPHIARFLEPFSLQSRQTSIASRPEEGRCAQRPPLSRADHRPLALSRSCLNSKWAVLLFPSREHRLALAPVTPAAARVFLFRSQMDQNCADAHRAVRLAFAQGLNNG